MPEQTDAEPGFWRRQFSDDVTTPQLKFDVAFGVVLPVLCFVFDPAVFKGGFAGSALIPELAQYKILVYLFSGLSIVTLSLWLVMGSRIGWPGGVVAGVLLSGSLCSLLIGLLILPLTLFGLLLLIGVLGFIPFVTSFVYLRNSVRASNRAKVSSGRPRLAASLLLGAALAVGPPALAHRQLSREVTRLMDALLRGDARAAESAVRRLRYLGWAVDVDEMVRAYSREPDPARRDNLARAYKEITGEDIKTRLAVLVD